MIQEERYIDFLIQHELTQTQYLALHLIYKGRLDLIKLYKDYFKIKEDSPIISDYEKKDLIRKEFVVVKKGNIFLSDKFKQLFVDEELATDELYYRFPDKYKDTELKLVDRKVIAQLYMRAIMDSIEEHEEVLKDVTYGKENNLITTDIKTFVKSKAWLGLRKMRVPDRESTSAANIKESDL